MTQLAHDPTIQADGLTLADLKHVAPRSAKLNAAGHLEVAGVDLVELAQRVGTAIYVMDEAQIRSQLQEWQSALAKHWPNSMVAYAGKAFLCKAMCRLVDGEGAWLDVSSGGELAVALAAGFDPSRIIMHGNNKTDRELNEALDAGVGRIVVDSFEELNNLQCLARARDVQQQILLRIKPGVVADTHQHIATGGEDSKFGFGIADGWALKAIKLALLTPEATELCGLHFHIGSQIYALDSYEQA
ncbi:MAG: diaminopimelate decarboxylase, partial [Coriobacteriia bacterium]|nr:diaminopimelate decarboxylase [Coriobacteriia bacterium]